MLAAASFACATQTPLETPDTVEVEPGTVFTLRVGQEAAVGDSLRIRLVGVGDDSRCQRDVVCVWAGDARVRLLINLAGAPEREVELHTSLDPRSTAVGRYMLSLRALLPEPRSFGAIRPEAYTAALLLAPD